MEGYDIGLAPITKRQDPELTAYASYWIKQSIRRAVMSQGKTFRLPAYMVSLLARWRRATAVLTERLGRMSTPEEVGQALRLSKKKTGIVVQAIRVNNLVPSAENAEADEDGLGQLLDERSREADELVLEADEIERIFRGLEQLGRREAAVIRMRFGLDPYPPMTLRQVGEHLGLTRERVRQLESQALWLLMEMA
jgi:RNA polymerase primary sigma factor